MIYIYIIVASQDVNLLLRLPVSMICAIGAIVAMSFLGSSKVSCSRMKAIEPF